MNPNYYIYADEKDETLLYFMLHIKEYYFLYIILYIYTLIKNH